MYSRLFLFLVLSLGLKSSCIYGMEPESPQYQASLRLYEILDASRSYCGVCTEPTGATDSLSLPCGHSMHTHCWRSGNLQLLAINQELATCLECGKNFTKKDLLTKKQMLAYYSMFFIKGLISGCALNALGTGFRMTNLLKEGNDLREMLMLLYVYFLQPCARWQVYLSLPQDNIELNYQEVLDFYCKRLCMVYSLNHCGHKANLLFNKIIPEDTMNAVFFIKMRSLILVHDTLTNNILAGLQQQRGAVLRDAISSRDGGMSMLTHEDRLAAGHELMTQSENAAQMREKAKANYWAEHRRMLVKFAPEIVVSGVGTFLGYKYCLPAFNQAFTYVANSMTEQVKKLALAL